MLFFHSQFHSTCIFSVFQHYGRQNPDWSKRLESRCPPSKAFYCCWSLTTLPDLQFRMKVISSVTSNEFFSRMPLIWMNLKYYAPDSGTLEHVTWASSQFNQEAKCGAMEVAISWPPEFTGSCYYEIATAQIKCSTYSSCTHEYKQCCSKTTCIFKGWRTSPFTFSLTDFTFNFTNISDYTKKFAVNGVLQGFDLDISFANKSQNYRADWKIFTYAQKSSTVSNFEIRRRFACQVLLLSFLKNQSAHLKENKIKTSRN